MKKLIFGAVSLLMGSVFFAQNAEYRSHLEKAKNFQNEKNWVRALGEYWDAMEAEPTVASYEAYTAYTDIAYSLQNGKPGLGDFSKNELIPAWEAALREFEVYWTENCPRQFEFSKITMMKADSSSMLTYSTLFKCSWIPKYMNMLDVFESGYKRVKTDSMIEWPKNAFSNGDGIENAKSKRNRHLASIYKPNLYTLTFNLVGKDGKVIAENCSVKGGDNFLLKFPEPEVVEMIENEEITFIPISLTLQNRKDPYDLKDISIDSAYNENRTELVDVVLIVRDASSLISCKDDFPRMMKMLTVEGGSFMMGNSNGSASQKPVHKVTVDSFELGQTEVTQELYEYVMRENPSLYKGKRIPVTGLSWNDAVVFCNKLSVISDRTPCYALDGETDVEKWNYNSSSKEGLRGTITCNFNADGFRLPTEAEWEYAARGAGKADYEFSGSNDLLEVAVNGDTSGLQPQEVCSKKPNDAGFYDMSGNAWEWCWDWFTKYTEAAIVNPRGDDTGFGRIVRGGGCLSFIGSCAVAYRYSKPAEKKELFYGLRLARSVKTAK